MSKYTITTHSGKKVVCNHKLEALSLRGWTYILISDCFNYIKIGRTKTKSASARVKYWQKYKPYQSANFKFLAAYNTYQLESYLHGLFTEYRIEYSRRGMDPKKDNITSWGLIDKQVNSLIWYEFKKPYTKNISSGNQSRTELIYQTICFSQPTEVFKVPPRKIGRRIETIIKNRLLTDKQLCLK